MGCKILPAKRTVSMKDMVVVQREGELDVIQHLERAAQDGTQIEIE